MLAWALVDQSGQAQLDDLARIVEALDKLYARFADAWRFVPSHGVASTTADPIAGAVLGVKLVGDDPNVPNALGFHDVALGGVPFIEVELAPILQNGGGWLMSNGAGASVASVVSHELFEASVDPYCGGWEWDPSRNLFLATEVSDPVQGALIPVSTSDGAVVELSDAVTPPYFSSSAPTDGSVAFSLNGTATAPFQNTPGGYQILFDPAKINDPAGPVSNVWGEKMPAWLRAYKSRPGCRTIRRFASAALRGSA